MSIPIGNQLVLASNATGSVALMDVQYIKGAFKVYDTAADLADVIVAQISDNQIIWLEESSSLYQANITPADPFNGIPDATVTWSAFQFPGGNSTPTGSLLTTASAANNIITFTKGDGNTFAVTVDTGSGGDSFPYTGSAVISGSLKTIGVEASHLDGQFDLTSSITVTAAAPTSNNRYASQNPTNVYYLNGIESPYINFYPGKSYIFKYPASHPLKFYIDDSTGGVGGTQYTTGVSTPAANQVQIDVTENTPSILYYMCTSHAYMGNAAYMESSAVSASLAQTASYVETAQTASYIVTAQTASYILNAVSASYAVSASHEIIKEVSSSYADTAEVARGLENTPSIAVTNITASGPISSSGALFVSASENSTVDKVALYNDTTGQLFYTASSAIGGGGTAIKATGSGLDGGSPGGDISTITIQDYDTNVVVQYNAGDLRFIFGEPTAPTPSIGQSGFQEDRFNLELQTYTVTGTFGLGGYSLVSASLFSGSTLLETGDSGLTLSRSFSNVPGPVDGGQFSYSLQVTSSNPVTSAEDKQEKTLNLSLNKLNPVGPSFSSFDTSLVEDGVISDKIEYNATGSISYTGSKSSTDRNWTFVSMSANVTYAPIEENNSTISGSVLLSDYSADGTITLRLTSHYNSAALNNPIANASVNSSNQIYQRTRSVRTAVFPTSQTGSFEADYFNISLLEKSGSINRGTINPNNLSVSLTGTSITEGNYQYILIDNTYTLSAIEIGGNNYLTPTFNNTYSTNSGWKIYKSKKLGSGTTTYLLKT